MHTVLSLFGLALFCATIIGLAMGVTWSVVKLLPLKEKKPKPPVVTPTES